VTKDARAAGQGVGIQWCQLVSAILHNGLGRYDRALEEARQASEQQPELYVSAWALPELIEAASRTGQTQLATDALGRLAEATSAAQTAGVRRAYPRRAGGHRRDRPPAHRRSSRRAHPPRGPYRPPGPRRPVQPGDRRPAVPVRPDGRMAPAQSVHQTRDQLPPATPAGAARRRRRRTAGMTGRQESTRRTCAAQSLDTVPQPPQMRHGHGVAHVHLGIARPGSSRVLPSGRYRPPNSQGKSGQHPVRMSGTTLRSPRQQPPSQPSVGKDTRGAGVRSGGPCRARIAVIDCRRGGRSLFSGRRWAFHELTAHELRPGPGS
jgi:hypothetical protein